MFDHTEILAAAAAMLQAFDKKATRPRWKNPVFSSADKRSLITVAYRTDSKRWHKLPRYRAAACFQVSTAWYDYW